MKFIGRNNEIKRLKEAVVDNKSKLIILIFIYKDILV